MLGGQESGEDMILAIDRVSCAPAALITRTVAVLSWHWQQDPPAFLECSL
jgi:hypothetical protein